MYNSSWKRTAPLLASIWCGTVCGQSFPNGVAAGDVDQTSVVLWARSAIRGPVVFEFATNSPVLNWEQLVVEVDDPNVPAKVVVVGLLPGTEYFCRAVDADGSAAIGRFRTPRRDGRHGLRFGVSGDWRGELRPYPALGNISHRGLDFFVALGDTIYADFPSIDFPASQARIVEEFRVKHNEVYSERFGMNSWAEVRASTAWFATIDDHEVVNDFAGGAPPESDPRFDMTGEFINETALFSNGLQVFYEFNPIRDEFYGETGDPRTAGKRKLYRFRTFGEDAAILILDARSFRDEPLEELLTPPGRKKFLEFLEASFDPTRSMLGAVQLEELKADLLRAEQAGVTWKFIMVPEPIQNLGPILASDRFEGYAFERSELLGFIDDHGIENVVFVAADIHGTIVNNLSYQRRPRGRQIESSAFEVTTGPVAFAAPLGPTAFSFAPSWLASRYENLDADGQNDLFRSVGNFYLDLYGYSRFGLSRSAIDAALIDGGYVVANTYGWTEFQIDAGNQCLTVTTYGVDWYDAVELTEDPAEVLSREPRTVSQFRVRPWTPLEASSSEDFPEDADAQQAGCHLRATPCGAFDGFLLLSLHLALIGSRSAYKRRRPRTGRLL